MGDAQTPWREVRRLVTSDGVAISAAHAPMTPRARPATADGPSSEPGSALVFVVGHGFSGSWRRPSITSVATVLSEYGGVVALDFRGHGRSGGVSTVGDREVLDIEAVVAWARMLGYRSVATVGFSMGASVVVRHAALIGDVDAVVAVSGPSRWHYRGTAPMRRVHWIIERWWGRAFARAALRTRISRGEWDPQPEEPRAVVGRVAPTPLLIVHGDDDHYFPLDHASELADAGGANTELWIEPGFGHAESSASTDLIGRIGSWVVKQCG